MTQLFLTFEGPLIGERGVPVDALVSALQGVQDALQLMVERLANYQRKRGRVPKWIKDQSVLQLAATRPGSFVAELALNAEAVGSGGEEGYGERALDAFQRWEGGYGSTLPDVVVDRLLRIPSSLPDDLQLWLGDTKFPRRMETIPSYSLAETALDAPEMEDALVHGWLKVVNWDKRTAELHRYGGRHVKLRFDAAMDDELRRLANRFVEIRGAGRINSNDRWQWVRVEEITEARSGNQPFDIEAFLNNPNPKIFDPEKVVTASEPFDVDEFIRAIRESRDA